VAILLLYAQVKRKVIVRATTFSLQVKTVLKHGGTINENKDKFHTAGYYSCHAFNSVRMRDVQDPRQG
jgi:hypothetical protein